jgi:hypothetical protein
MDEEQELWLELYKTITNKDINAEVTIRNSDMEVQHILILRTEIVTKWNGDDVIKESYIASNFINGCSFMDCLVDVVNKIKNNDWIYY